MWCTSAKATTQSAQPAGIQQASRPQHVELRQRQVELAPFPRLQVAGLKPGRPPTAGSRGLEGPVQECRARIQAEVTPARQAASDLGVSAPGVDHGRARRDAGQHTWTPGFGRGRVAPKSSPNRAWSSAFSAARRAAVSGVMGQIVEPNRLTFTTCSQRFTVGFTDAGLGECRIEPRGWCHADGMRPVGPTGMNMTDTRLQLSRRSALRLAGLTGLSAWAAACRPMAQQPLNVAYPTPTLRPDDPVGDRPATPADRQRPLRARSAPQPGPHRAAPRADRRGAASFAAIITNSNSRATPEVIFDQGLGDLFVVRVAGMALDDEVIGSIEYAVEHLGVKAILVLGPERSGSVRVAVKSVLDHQPKLEELSPLIEGLRPSIVATEREGDVWNNTVNEHTLRVAEPLAAMGPLLRDFVVIGELKIGATRCDSDTGLVTVLKRPIGYEPETSDRGQHRGPGQRTRLERDSSPRRRRPPRPRRRPVAESTPAPEEATPTSSAEGGSTPIVNSTQIPKSRVVDGHSDMVPSATPEATH